MWNPMHWSLFLEPFDVESCALIIKPWIFWCGILCTDHYALNLLMWNPIYWSSGLEPFDVGSCALIIRPPCLPWVTHGSSFHVQYTADRFKKVRHLHVFTVKVLFFFISSSYGQIIILIICVNWTIVKLFLFTSHEFVLHCTKKFFMELKFFFLSRASLDWTPRFHCKN